MPRCSYHHRASRDDGVPGKNAVTADTRSNWHFFTGNPFHMHEKYPMVIRASGHPQSLCYRNSTSFFYGSTWRMGYQVSMWLIIKVLLKIRERSKKWLPTAQKPFEQDYNGSKHHKLKKYGTKYYIPVAANTAPGIWKSCLFYFSMKNVMLNTFGRVK